MTKNAQQALRYLIQQYNKNIRFVLICNYISKIDSALQNEFIRLCLHWTRCGGVCTRNNDSDHRTTDGLNTNDNTRGCAMC